MPTTKPAICPWHARFAADVLFDALADLTKTEYRAYPVASGFEWAPRLANSRALGEEPHRLSGEQPRVDRRFSVHSPVAPTVAP